MGFLNNVLSAMAGFEPIMMSITKIFYGAIILCVVVLILSATALIFTHCV